VISNLLMIWRTGRAVGRWKDRLIP